jgi:hypothetical protein
MENMKRQLAKWGFQLAQEAPTTRTVFPNSLRPAPERESTSSLSDVERVKQILEKQGVTPAQILRHPYLILSQEAKQYLESLCEAAEKEL